MKTESDKAEPKKRPLKTILYVALTVLFVLFAIYTIHDLFFSGAGVGHFKSAEGHRAYLSAYDEVMATLSAPTEVRDVPTTWGTVRVYRWANTARPNALPVVLLPGHSSGAPMWSVNLPDFMAGRTVYAIDALGDAGKSAQTVPQKDIRDVAGWINETLAALGIERAHIAGYSFGGGYAASFALYHPERVATLTLLEPAFALNFPSASTLFWATIGSMEFLPKAWRDHGLAKISGESPADLSNNDEPLTRMIAAAASSYATSLPTPKTLTDKELAGGLPMPVYVALADKSPMTGDAALKQAKKIANAEVKVWENTTHSLPMQVTGELDAELERFWARNE